jgi:hypothetical protein
MGIRKCWENAAPPRSVPARIHRSKECLYSGSYATTVRTVQFCKWVSGESNRFHQNFASANPLLRPLCPAVYRIATILFATNAPSPPTIILIATRSAL